MSLILLENDGCGGAPSMLFKYEYEDNLIAEGAIAIPNDAQSYNYDEEKGTVYFKFLDEGYFIHCYYEYTDYGIIEYSHTGYDPIDGSLEFDEWKYHSMSNGGSSNEEDCEIEKELEMEWAY